MSTFLAKSVSIIVDLPANRLDFQVFCRNSNIMNLINLCAQHVSMVAKLFGLIIRVPA
jgi:hypothetical protein